VGVLAAAGAVLVATGGTSASFTDVEAGAPSQAGAATVVLGRDGAAPSLAFPRLEPGRPVTVLLTVEYGGTVAADLTLAVAPGGKSDFCHRPRDTWSTRPGVPVTVSIGGGAPVSWCALYDGERVPLGTVAPGQRPTVPVTVTLAADAGPSADRRTENAAVTVHADGGFTDSATGPLSATTAAARGPRPPVAAVAAVASPGAAPSVALDAADPAATARAATEGATVALPEACIDAGIDPAAIVEVIAVDPLTRVFDGAARGRGAGPFLVLGTDGPDVVTGSTAGDCVVGGAGDDRLDGAEGADALLGGAGLDELTGGPGADRLDGGRGSAGCDADPADRVTACRAPATPTTVPPTPTSPALAPPAEPVAPPAGPVEPVAPAVPPAEPVAEPVEEPAPVAPVGEPPVDPGAEPAAELTEEAVPGG
jgi:predicted ribosomally synthesized peptide with SipW-like signal peptide